MLTEKAKSLVGTWILDCTAVVQGVAFPGLMSFTSDGIVLTCEPPSPLETPGFGTWVSASPTDAAYTFLFFIGSNDNTLTSKAKVIGDAHYDIDLDRWTGTFKIEIVDANGKQMMADHGKFSGIRVAVEKVETIHVSS